MKIASEMPEELTRIIPDMALSQSYYIPVSEKYEHYMSYTPVS